MGWQPLIELAEAAEPGSNGVVFIPHVFGSYGPRLNISPAEHLSGCPVHVAALS